MRHRRTSPVLPTLAAAAVALLLAAPASADTLPAARAERTVPEGAAIPCRCRADGVLYDQGAEVCVAGRIARCAMNQNVPTWTPLNRPCPIAATPVRRPSEG